MKVIFFFLLVTRSVGPSDQAGRVSDAGEGGLKNSSQDENLAGKPKQDGEYVS